MSSLPVFSRQEVAQHSEAESAWIIVHDLVYDITSFVAADAHPGSTEILLENLGSDASAAFECVGHSRHAHRLLQKFLIGRLPEAECVSSINKENIVYTKIASTAIPLVASTISLFSCCGLFKKKWKSLWKN